MNACTILNGTLAWDVTGTRDCSKCLDIDPEMLYELENVSEKDCIRNCRHSMVAIIINISLILGAYYLHK